ncbi:DNA helicase B [Mantella aurantiaca]
MSSRRARSRNGEGEGWRQLKGRLLPVKEEGGESDRDEDGEALERSDPEFLDAEEIEGGAVQIPSFSPENSTVKLLAEDLQEYMVLGFFPLTDPWWSVTVDVKPGRSLWFVMGFPSYRLEDDIIANESILSLFLRECKVHEDFLQPFVAWVKYYPPVTFSRLISLAEKFKETHDKNIIPYLMNSACGSFVFNALQIPLVLRYLPKLLPHKMRSLLKLDAKDCLSAVNTPPDHMSAINKTPHILFGLEKILNTEPWKLGFALILFRELHLSGCEAKLDSFLQCDEDLQKKIPDLQRHALYIYSDLQSRCMNLGDTYIEQSNLNNAACKVMSTEHAWEAIDFLKGQEIVMVDQERVFLHNYYVYEENTADFIKRLVTQKPRNPEVEVSDVLGDDHTTQNEEKVFCSSMASQTFSDEQMKDLQINDCMTEENHITKLDAEQQRAASMILTNPVTIISGKGGCGKTTVVSLVFKALMQKEKNMNEEYCKAYEDDKDASEEWVLNDATSSFVHNESICIVLTAPTGKAASLLRKKTELPAATLHQITCSYSAWKNQKQKKEESGEEHKVPWKFSKVEALVVDEGSLVSIRIFSAVLKLLCTHARLAKLVVLGDIRQLPSIEPGNLLADIFATFQRMNWAIELKTNHRAESQLIVDNATRISNQKSLDFDAVVHFDGSKTSEMPSEEKKFILVSLADELDLCTAIKALLERGPGLQDHKRSQFIAFRRKDCLLINEQCCRHYSQHSIKNSRNRFDFRCGDKVCCTKNAYVKDLQTKSRSQCADENNTDSITQSQKCADDERICNGEIFYITDDVEKDKIRELTLSDGEEREYTLNYKALRSRSGLSFAWARTIHTFQGSEEDTIVYVLGTAGRQNWKHVYTAVTRGRKRVYIIAKSNELDRAIASKSRERKTRLQQRLKDKLSQSGAWPQRSTSGSTIPINTQLTQERAGLASQEYPCTQSPPRFKCPSVPSTPDVASSRKGRDHSEGHATRSPSCSLMNRECPALEESPSQKRVGIPLHDMATPPKLNRMDNFMNLAETSPSSSLEKLSIQSGSCSKQLFNH